MVKGKDMKVYKKRGVVIKRMERKEKYVEGKKRKRFNQTKYIPFSMSSPVIESPLTDFKSKNVFTIFYLITYYLFS